MKNQNLEQNAKVLPPQKFSISNLTRGSGAGTNASLMKTFCGGDTVLEVPVYLERCLLIQLMLVPVIKLMTM